MPCRADNRFCAGAGHYVAIRPRDSRRSESRLHIESRMFGPPFGPTDFMGSAGRLHDDLLFGGAECPIEARQRGLDEPWLDDDPSGLAIGIKLFGHSQWYERFCDAPGVHKHPDDYDGQAMARAVALPCFLDRIQGCAGRGVVAFERAFGELENEGLGRGDIALGSAFTDFHHLA